MVATAAKIVRKFILVLICILRIELELEFVSKSRMIDFSVMNRRLYTKSVDGFRLELTCATYLLNKLRNRRVLILFIYYERKPHMGQRNFVETSTCRPHEIQLIKLDNFQDVRNVLPNANLNFKNICCSFI